MVVLDAPPAPGRSTLNGTVLGQPVRFNAGFPDILAASGRKYLFYAISLRPGNDGSRMLELEMENTPGDTLMDEYCRYLGAHLAEDSAQWRIWQVAGQFFQHASSEPGADVHVALESEHRGN